jgi:hypothetical protein
MPYDPFQWCDPFLGSPKTEMVTGSVPEDSLAWSGASWGRARPLALHLMYSDMTHTFTKDMLRNSSFLRSLADPDRV